MINKIITFYAVLKCNFLQDIFFLSYCICTKKKRMGRFGEVVLIALRVY